MSSTAAQDLSELDADPRLFLYTSLTSGSSHIVSATSRLETILKVHKIPFLAVDIATDEKARKLWSRRAGKRRLPGLVKEGFVLGDMTEVEEWNEYGELKENIGPLPEAGSLPATVPFSTQTQNKTLVPDKESEPSATTPTSTDRDPSAHTPSVTLARTDGLPVKVDPAKLSDPPGTSPSTTSAAVQDSEPSKDDILAEPTPETSHSSAADKRTSIDTANEAAAAAAAAATPSQAARSSSPSTTTTTTSAAISSPVAVTDLPVDEASRRELTPSSLPVSTPPSSSSVTTSSTALAAAPRPAKTSVVTESETETSAATGGHTGPKPSSMPLPAIQDLGLGTGMGGAAVVSGGDTAADGAGGGVGSHHRGSEVRHASQADIAAAEESRRIVEDEEEEKKEDEGGEAGVVHHAAAAEQAPVKGEAADADAAGISVED